VFVLVSLVAIYLLRDFPQNFLKERDEELICRPEATKLLEMVKNEQAASGAMLGREPYFPFDSSKPGSSIQYWGASMQDLDRDNIGIFGTKKAFGEQFLKEGPEYNMYEKVHNWKDKQALYQKVFSGDTFTTPAGHTFKKVYEDGCGFQFWKR
jgi:hypothetical protein